jgi:hypothetical protein
MSPVLKTLKCLSSGGLSGWQRTHIEGVPSFISTFNGSAFFGSFSIVSEAFNLYFETFKIKTPPINNNFSD